MMKNILLTCFFFILIAQLSAQDASALYISGKAVYIRDGKTAVITKGQELKTGDLLRTIGKSTLIIRYPDDSRVKMNASTELKLAKGRQGEKSIDISAGSVFSKIIKLPGGNPFSLTCGVMHAGVRGTEFFFGFGKKAEDLWLCVNEGSVGVENSGSTETLVNAGDGIFITTESISKPKPYAWTKKLNWKMDDAEGEVEETGALDKAYKELRRNYD